MLNQPRWMVHDPGQKQDPVDHSWARPDGWLSVLWRMAMRRKNSNTSGRASGLWTLLALISLFGFLGLPLSGLAMDFDTGYIFSQQVPIVTGYDNSFWNSRFKSTVSQRAFLNWNSNSQPSMPGSGVVHTAADANRSSYWLEYLPNILPNDTGIPRLYLAPQAQNPIHGRSWGLLFSYECTVVREVSEFTIMSHRKASTNLTSSPSSYSVLGGNATIQIYNQTNDLIRASFADNLQAVAEIGHDDAGQTEREAASPPSASECYNPIPLPPNSTIPYPGLDRPQALELALWQNLSARDLAVEDPPTVNLSLTATIPELLGAYNNSNTSSGAPAPMAAVGVRCMSASEVGTADLDGRRATYASFRRSDHTASPSSSSSSRSGLQCAGRLSLGVPSLVFREALASSDPTEWLGGFYLSVGRYQRAYAEQDYEFGGLEVRLQGSYLQADELRVSLLRAYSVYTMELAYNSGVRYVDKDGTYVVGTSLSPGAVSYLQTTVLVPGMVPPVVVSVLLTLWAGGSLVLGVLYRFR